MWQLLVSGCQRTTWQHAKHARKVRLGIWTKRWNESTFKCQQGIPIGASLTLKTWFSCRQLMDDLELSRVLRTLHGFKTHASSHMQSHVEDFASGNAESMVGDRQARSQSMVQSWVSGCTTRVAAEVQTGVVLLIVHPELLWSRKKAVSIVFQNSLQTWSIFYWHPHIGWQYRERLAIGHLFFMKELGTQQPSTQERSEVKPFQTIKNSGFCTPGLWTNFETCWCC